MSARPIRLLLTGASGVVGSEVSRQLAAVPGLTVARVARRPADGVVGWSIGHQPPPDSLRGRWDVIVHSAASTRWTMTRAEAIAANIEPLRGVLTLADDQTHVVHVSTSYVAGEADGRNSVDFGRYRNGYEWSKAQCEEEVHRHPGAVTIVRPPLVLGDRHDGSIARFSGPYTILQSLLSGLAAVVVGDADGYAEIAPVDQVAEVIVAAAIGRPPSAPEIAIVTGGDRSLRLTQLLDIVTGELNAFRADSGVGPIVAPPLVSSERWHRFFLPLVDEYLTPIQGAAVQLLGMFESYTSLRTPFAPTHPVEDPADVLARSVRFWAATRPRLALRSPTPWALIAPKPTPAL